MTLHDAPMIRVEHLCKTFEGHGAPVHAVDDVSFDVADGEFFVLLGASGSGKTTTLRILAALEEADSGTIVMDSHTVYSGTRRLSVRSGGRPIAMMFQSFALWPHMTVAKNIGFPLRHGRSKLARREINERIDESLSLLHISDLRDRPVSALSGGQQQRVALARAVAQEPKVLLMDEPLSALDAKLRIELRLSLRDLTHRLGMTTVYVTHDQTEAMVMADRIGVMRDGQLLQTGSPEEVYRQPASIYVAEFFGEINVVPGRVVAHGQGLPVVDTPLGRVRSRFAHAPDVGDEVLVGARQEAVEVLPDRSHDGTPARIASAAFVGDAYMCTVRIASGEQFKVRADADHRWREGDEVTVRLLDRPVVGFAASDGDRIDAPGSRPSPTLDDSLPLS